VGPIGANVSSRTCRDNGASKTMALAFISYFERDKK
jgi:hypothetical protein